MKIGNVKLSDLTEESRNDFEEMWQYMVSHGSHYWLGDDTHTDDDGVLHVHDRFEGGEPIKLTRAGYLRGLNKHLDWFADPKRPRWFRQFAAFVAIGDFDMAASEMDAEVADCALQFAAFGKLVYG